MSLFSDMNDSDLKELVWKALADGTRRDMLDALAAGPLTTGQLVERFNTICRTNVMKHLEILVQANLVVIRREGRLRWNYLNPTPIQRICDRWVSKHVKKMASALSQLKDHVENTPSVVQGPTSSQIAKSKNKSAKNAGAKKTSMKQTKPKKSNRTKQKST